MKQYVFFFLLFFIPISNYAQCELATTATEYNITCGTCVTLTAFGEGQGASVFEEDFNTGAPTGWQSTAQATYTNPCDPTGVDGTTHLWMGDATGVPRQMTTTAFDLSTATAGATICFDMLFAEQGDASPCEGPDEPDEGVYLQYSIDGGVTWVTIHYFDPNGGNDASLVNWNNWCFQVPAAALTANTQFRWFQDNDSGADYDHWGLDNVNIYFNDPTYNITWEHDGYSYGIGNSGGDNPTQVCPQTTTTYTANMSNGTDSCSSTVTINVVPPVFRVNAESDTTICAGQCVDLAGEATIIVSPAKTPTYDNSEISALTGLPSAADLANLLLPCANFGGCTCPDGSTVPFLGQCPTIYQGTLEMNINITDLNTTTIQNGQLTSVCIGDAIMAAGDFSVFEVTLTCPSGASIILANVGDITGTTLNNTCFDLTSTTPISSGTSPYNGTFQPVQPLTNLSGCDANGVWTLSFTGTFDLQSGNLPLGFLNGWDISFDDPEIIYTGIYAWSPTTNMTNPNSLTPTVCPTQNTTYTLTVQDSAFCASASDQVTVNVTNTNCCPFEINYIAANPSSCGVNDGSIDVTITNGSGNYSFSWDNGLPPTEDAINLGSGAYTITVYDSAQACQKDTTITLTAPNSPVIDSVITVGTVCGNANGSATVFVNSGTPPYSYSLDGGTTFVSGTQINNLNGGSYNVIIQDMNNCTVSSSFIIDSSSTATIDSFQINATTCGQNNGTIEVFASSNQLPIQYSIDNGLTLQANSSFTNLSSGNYIVYIEDQTNCIDTQTVIVNPSSNPIIDSVITVAPSCGNADGSITIFASQGQASYQYSIDNGVSFQANNQFTGLAANSYQIVVEDASNCTVTQNVNLNALNAPIIDSVTFTNPLCATNNGEIIIYASGGTGPLNYSIDMGVIFTSSNIHTNLGPGLYPIVVTDSIGCSATFSQALTAPSGPNIDSVITNPTNCGNNDGEIMIYAVGNAPLLYSIDNGTTTQSAANFSNLAAGTYSIWVQDADLCISTQTISVQASNAPTILTIDTTSTTCGNDNGEIVITVQGGTPPFEYSIDNGASFQTSSSFTNLPGAAYLIVVREQNNVNCLVDSFTQINPSFAIDLNSATIEDESCIDFCDGNIALQLDFASSPVDVLMNGQNANLSMNNLCPDEYIFEVIDANNCFWTDTFTINSGLDLAVVAMNDTSIEEGESIQLNATGTGGQNATYEWSPSIGLSCVLCQEPIATILETTTYIVEYADDNCNAFDSLTIFIEEEPVFCLFPDAFSPNLDGFNDGYGPICNELAFVELKIYNRWGELIYQTTADNDLVRWDGKYKGKDVPLDVYTFVANLQYKNGDVEVQSGNFTVIR